ncbi:V-set and immunoglobulin domain-containing protein 10-like [Odontesthes bonariensis]|uniref:V-set and immunoglobulin domain-containing protein 10-like n=1 Tax=Odontesthes bonariensis TaxID=219752 RepID=UPI003F588C77
MKWMEELDGLNSVFLAVLFSFTFQGANCELVVSPAGPTVVNTLAGSTVTLAVSFSGAPDPVVAWIKENIPVGTWTIKSNSPPDIAKNSRDVLTIEKDGSLTFINVPLNFTGNYTVELTKSGLEKASTTFTLKIFENIQTVTLSTQPDVAKEGTERLTLNYSMRQGVVEQQIWYFNDRELKNNLHYLVEERSLVILRPNRSDIGRYTVLLSNPFSSVTAHKDVTVHYGPDEPIIVAQPAKPFHVAGDSLSLSCHAEGLPQPTVMWDFGGEILSDTLKGVLNLTNVMTSQGGVYTCTLLNELTEERREKAVTVSIFERPLGSPMCSVLSVNNVMLQYLCSWMRGTPQAQLSFPGLSNTSSGAGSFSLTVTASANFNKKTIICMADHPIEQNKCNITTSSPLEFIPAIRTTVDLDGKIVVTIHCISEASPEAVVSWFRGSEPVTSGTFYQISSNTTQLKIRDYNISNFLLQNYTCTCRNPLGSQIGQIQLQGPSISDSSLFPNKDGTVITLTWEVPPTSVVTGFDIQMKGPDLLNKNGNATHIKDSSNGFRTIQQKPGSARSTDIFVLDPNLTYRFRVIPKARMTDGEPSKVHRIGPGLSGPAIAGIAAGIPCSILFLLLLGGLIYLVVYCHRKKSHQTRYPVSRAVEKAKASQPDITPHNLMAGGLKSLPDYNRLQQTLSERSVSLPTFVPPPPVRVATTV